MALSLATVGGKITAALYNTLVNAVKAGGQSLIAPTSIVSSSGVATVTPLGLVSFTTAAAVSLNGVFSSTYENYVVEVDIDYASVAAVDILANLRAGGVNYSAATYCTWVSDLTLTSGNVPFVVNSGNTAIVALQANGASGGGTAGRLEIHGPALAVYKKAFSESVTSNLVRRANAQIGTNSIYDGLTISAASGTMTGRIRVYGINNG